MHAEFLAPAFDFLFRNHENGRGGELMQEGRVGVLQVAHDRLVVGSLGVIEEEQVVAPVVLRAVHRVSDVFGGEKAAVLELTRLEVHIVANGERVRFAVFGDFPLGGDAGQVLALVDVLLHERVTVVLTDLIGGGGVDVKRVERLRRNRTVERDFEDAALHDFPGAALARSRRSLRAAAVARASGQPEQSRGCSSSCSDADELSPAQSTLFLLHDLRSFPSQHAFPIFDMPQGALTPR